MVYEEDGRAVPTETRQTVTTEDLRARQPVVDPRADYHMNVAARIIWMIGGIIIGLLALRFLLRLLAANPNNGFADFIYTMSHPFASPFFGLFSYTENLGSGRFEFETLIAILVYGLVAWLLAKLVSIGKR